MPATKANTVNTSNADNNISLVTLVKSQDVWKLNINGSEITSAEFKVIVRFLASLQQVKN